MVDQHGRFVRFRFGYVIAALFALVLIAVIVNNLSKQSGDGEGISPSPSPTVTTNNERHTPSPDDEPAVDTSHISDVPQPTTRQVWQFETAYNSANPTLKAELFAKVATSQYTNDYYDGFSVSSEAVVEVDERLSTMSIDVDATRTVSYVVTRVVLIVSEGNVVDTKTLAPHGSYWINTQDGWKVAREASNN